MAFHPTDPQKIYIGAPSGGMWQSEDGGVHWVTHTDTLPTLGVSSILVDQSNPNQIFIGTGDRDAGDAPGLGVFKSNNHGLTWTPSNTGMGNFTVGDLVQHPGNSQIIIAATSGGIYRSTDHGSSWTFRKSGEFKDICFKPGHPDVVYAASNADFYRSTDNGISFTQITSGLSGGQRGTIAVTQANPEYVYFLVSDNNSGFKGLYRSTNSGLTFIEQSDSPNIFDWSCDGSGTGGQGWYDLALAADPLSANTIYAGGVDVWKSTDGGVTWEINSHWYGDCFVAEVHADCHFLAYSPVNGKLYAGNDGGIYSTNNGGTTWNDHTTGITIGQIYKLGQAQKEKNHVINGFQDNGTYSLTPTNWLATGGGDGMECAIDYTNDIYSYHTIYYGDIYRKYNNSNETHIAGNGINGITESGAWVTPFILHETDPKTMFIGYKNIWRSKNIKPSTPTWTRISDNLAGSNSSDISVVENSPVNTDILYVARSDHKLFRTDNCMAASPVWVDLSCNLPSTSAITDLEASTSCQDILYMTAGNQVFQSNDKGVTWINITLNLPSIHISTIACYRNDLDGLYLGTDGGVFYKNKNAVQWIPFSQGLPPFAKITELEIYYDSADVAQDVIRGCTYGRGLWSSDLFHGNPDAEFTASTQTLSAGCSNEFTDLSNGVPTSWLWTFTGGVPSTSDARNPVGISYPVPGIYSVKLKVWNEMGSDSVTKLNYITVTNAVAPVVDFSSDKNVCCIGEEVRFFDASDNCPTAWLWEFNPPTVDFLHGTSATSQNPVVSFEENLKYSITLTATNSSGTGSLTKTDYFLNGGYYLPYTEDFESGFADSYWTVLNPDGNKTWDTISVAGSSGQRAAWVNLYNYAMTNERRDQLISPALNFSGLANLRLNFRHAYAERASLRDSLIVKISDDCGLTWTRILAAGPDESPYVFVTHAATLDPFYPQSSTDWCGSEYGTECYEVDLSGYTNRDNIKILFESYNRHGNNLFIDDVSVSGTVNTNNNPLAGDRPDIFPNPASGSFFLHMPEKFSSAVIELYSVQGQLKFQQKITESEKDRTYLFDVKEVPPGFYICRITIDGTVNVIKLVIR